MTSNRAPARSIVLPGCVALAVATAVLPEVALRWLYPDAIMMAAVIMAPVGFVISAVSAYYVSGKRRITLLLWLLAPLCFFRLLEFFVAGLLWTIRGGMAYSTIPARRDGLAEPAGPGGVRGSVLHRPLR